MRNARIHLIAGCIFLGVALWWHIKKPVHVCSDPTHIMCDGECECDGMECPKE